MWCARRRICEFQSHPPHVCNLKKTKPRLFAKIAKKVARDKLERAVPSALQTHLTRDDLVEVFCAEHTSHMNALRAAQDNDRKARIAEKIRLEKGARDRT